MKTPNLFIVGQPKSGTTALHSFLEQHPDIFMSNPKEPAYFSKDFHKESDRFHDKKLYFSFRDKNSYLKLFSSVKKEKVVGESSTNYLYSKVAAKEIHSFNPNAKIIMMLREPVALMYSLYNQYLNETQENVGSFQEALSLEDSRKKGENIPSRIRSPSYLFYSERVKYLEQIRRYFDLFDKDKIKILIFEEFKLNNEETYKDVLKFLGVKDFEPEFKEVHFSKKPRSSFFNNVLRNPFLTKPFKVVLPMNFYVKIRDFFHNILMKKELNIPIDKELEKQLKFSYKKDILKLSKYLKEDLIKIWGYDKIEK